MNWSATGAILLAAAVALGAFGAHDLREKLDTSINITGSGTTIGQAQVVLSIGGMYEEAFTCCHCHALL